LPSSESFFSGYQAIPSCKVHPVVLFSILDHYSRRNEGQDRVIGTLLGVIGSDGVVEIRNCFPVPYGEVNKTSEVVSLVDMEFHKTMFDLHQKVNSKEVIVGWYATGSDVTENSLLIQNDFYAREISNPLHLVVNTILTGDKLGIKAFISNPLSIGDKVLGTQFQQIKVDIKTFEAERIGVDIINKARAGQPTDDGTEANLAELGNLEVSVKKLLQLLDEVGGYIDKVIQKKVAPDNKVGRFLADTLSVVPKINSVTFDKMFNTSLQDLLMVSYLGNITRTQLTLNSILNSTSIQQPK